MTSTEQMQSTTTSHLETTVVVASQNHAAQPASCMPGVQPSKTGRRYCITREQPVDTTQFDIANAI